MSGVRETVKGLLQMQGIEGNSLFYVTHRRGSARGSLV